MADPGFSPGGCANFQNCYYFQIFAENCMKMKEFGPPGGARVPGAPLGSANAADMEFSVTNFFCLHFSEHAQWGLPVMSDILVKIFVDISCNICGLFLL